MCPPAQERLEFADDMFARRHRIGRSPVNTQIVWCLPAVPEPAAIQAAVEHLAGSAIARTVSRCWVPLARDRWEPLSTAPRAADDIIQSMQNDPVLPQRDRLSWISDHRNSLVDPNGPRPFDLALIRTDDGGALASLTSSHAIADGASLFASFAAQGPSVPAPPGRAAMLLADLRDAAAQAREVTHWVAAHRRRQAVAAQRAARPSSTSSSTAESPTPPPDGWRPPIAALAMDSAEFASAAQRLGGSRGSLATAVLARVAVTIGRVAPGDDIPVAIPVSARESDDRRANATRIAAFRLPAETLRSDRLEQVKLLSTQAYSSLGDTPRELMPVPLSGVQALPDQVVARLPEPPAAAVLASNVGRLAPDVTGFLGVPASAILTFASHTGDCAAELAGAGGGVLGWLTEVNGTSTITAVGAYPSADATDERLGEVLADAARESSLPGRSW